jgi:hypothetical protein
MESNSTVSINLIEGNDSLRMTWKRDVVEGDVKSAFQKIVTILDKSEKPIFVMVDLRQNPQFPLRTTIIEAMKAYKHPMLTAWLIVGTNSMAKIIEATLSSLTRRKNVYWFVTEQDALAYMSQN